MKNIAYTPIQGNLWTFQSVCTCTDKVKELVEWWSTDDLQFNIGHLIEFIISNKIWSKLHNEVLQLKEKNLKQLSK